jgi:hypothetical protein
MCARLQAELAGNRDVLSQIRKKKGIEIIMNLTKEEKETILLTSEADDIWSVYTFNTALQKKLAAFAERYPDHCRLKIKDAETGSVTYEVAKAGVTIRLNAPYTEERRRTAREKAKAFMTGAGKEAENG